MEEKDQSRVLLAFALSALVLLFFAPKAKKPEPAKNSAPQSQSAKQSPSAPPAPSAQPMVTPKQAAPATSAAQTTSAAPATTVSASAETETVISSGLYEVHFTNRGAVATNWLLKNFESNGKELDLVNPLATAQTGWPFAIYSDDETVRSPLAGALYTVTATSKTAPSTVTFEYGDGSLHARKEFHFEPDSYVVRVSTEVTRDGRPVVHELSWRGGFGDRSVQDYNLGTSVILTAGEKQDRKGIKDVKTDAHVAGPFSYVAIEDHFFVAAFMPGGEGDAPAAVSGTIPGAALFKNSYSYGIGNPIDLMGVAVGGDAANHLRVYVGPKKYDVLKTIATDPRNQKAVQDGQTALSLASIIDFGWFAVVALPMFMALKWIVAHWVANYGWAIVILTVGINFVLFPLKLSSMKSAMKMQKLAPQVKAIQERYKKYKMNDPKKAEMNEEVMALYKKEGVNPLGGCLPMLIQLPFLYGFYRVLSQAVEMRHAAWMWVPDLSVHEPFFVHVLPIMFLVSMVILQKMTPQAPGGDPVQQKMMMMMPIMMGVMFYNVSSGLVLYWLSSNIVQLGQQWYINKTAPSSKA